MVPQQHSRCYASLPAEVLVVIMQQLPHTFCLSSCALVCRSWAAAAGAASATVQTCLTSQEAAHGLEAFLQRHGPAITHLAIVPGAADQSAAAGAVAVRLPLQRLCRLHTLELGGVRVHAAPPAASRSPGGGTTADSSPAAAAAPTGDGGGTRSTRLLPCLAHVSAVPSALADLASVLQEQQRPLSGMGLRTLKLGADASLPGAADVLRHAGTTLQGVCLVLYHSRRQESMAPWLEQLRAQHLTSLRVLGITTERVSKLSIDAASQGLLSRLTNLQRLELTMDAGDGANASEALAALTQLTRLDLTHCPLDPAIIPSPAFTATITGRRRLLRALGSLQQLRHLSLDFELLPLDPAGADFSALTASSQLTHLALQRAILPPGGGAAMFASPGRPAGWLPALKCLRFTKPAHQFGPYKSCGWPSSETGNRIADMVACCPNLEQLWMFDRDHARGPDPPELRSVLAGDVRRLAALAPTLTELQLDGCGCVDDAAARGVLAQLRRLQRLNLENLPAFSDAGLLALTALQQLTWLHVRSCGVSFEVARGAPAFFLVNSAQEGAVWRRLRQACMRSAACSAAVVSDLEAALAAAERRAAQAEARADRLEQQLLVAAGGGGGGEEAAAAGDGGAAQ